MNKLIESLQKCKVEGNTVFLPSENLSNYKEVRDALIKAGGKYNRNKFVFASNAQPLMDRLLSGSTNVKKEFQFYGTPDDVADFMVQHALLSMPWEIRILEPSAGHGALIKAIQREGHRPVYYCELMPENREVLKTLEQGEYLGDDFYVCLGEDFLLLDPEEKFDVIIANPPFSKNQDIDHIYKMYNHLEEGGRIVTIASNHWQFASGKKEKQFKTFIESVEADIYPLDSGQFKKSGTMVSCCILVIDK